MIELHIRPMEADAEGWVEVCLVTQPMDMEGSAYVANDRGEAEGETVGYVKVVEGTEEGPHEWWDAKVIDDAGAAGTKVHVRRFMSLDAALLALAYRKHVPRDTQKLLGW